MKEYDFGYAIVKIHPGKRSEAERKEVFENASKQFWKAIQKAQAAKKAAAHSGGIGSGVSGSERCHGVVCGGIQ